MSHGFRAKPVLIILVANVLFITVAPRIWFEILAETHRTLSPIVGRTAVTYIQVMLTGAAGGAWLYAWRESFRRLYRKTSKNTSKNH